MIVYVATTIYRHDPPYDDEGYPNTHTFIDGVFSSADDARRFALASCGADSAIWRTARRRGGWLAGHLGDEMHFHHVASWIVDDPDHAVFLGGQDANPIPVRADAPVDPTG